MLIPNKLCEQAFAGLFGQSQALSALFLPVVSRISARTGLPLKPPGR